MLMEGIYPVAQVCLSLPWKVTTTVSNTKKEPFLCLQTVETPLQTGSVQNDTIWTRRADTEVLKLLSYLSSSLVNTENCSYKIWQGESYVHFAKWKVTRMTKVSQFVHDLPVSVLVCTFQQTETLVTKHDMLQKTWWERTVAQIKLFTPGVRSLLTGVPWEIPMELRRCFSGSILYYLPKTWKWDRMLRAPPQ